MITIDIVNSRRGGQAPPELLLRSMVECGEVTQSIAVSHDHTLNQIAGKSWIVLIYLVLKIKIYRSRTGEI